MATKKSASKKAATTETAAEKTPAKKTAAKTVEARAAEPKAATKTAETKAAAKAKPTHDDVAVHAYLLWEREGKPHGDHEDYWKRAEQELNS